MLHENAGAGALNFARMTVFGVWLVIVALTPFHALAELPGTLRSPVGVMAILPESFWDWFINPRVLTGFRAALSFLLLTVVANMRSLQLLMLFAAAGLLLFDGALKSYGGFMNHGRFALLYVAILFSLVPAAPKAADDADHATRTPRMPGLLRIGTAGFRTTADPGSVLRLAAFLMAVAYALIGWHRFLNGGVMIFLDDSLPTYVMLRTFEPTRYTFELGYMLVGSTALIGLLKAGFFVTTVAEAASPFVIFHRRLRTVWLMIIVPFHFATLLTMNIFFWENLILIFLLFTDLPTRAHRWFSERGMNPGMVQGRKALPGGNPAHRAPRGPAPEAHRGHHLREADTAPNHR